MHHRHDKDIAMALFSAFPEPSNDSKEKWKLSKKQSAKSEAQRLCFSQMHSII